MDGFCGGGRYLFGGAEVDGSPLRTLAAVERAHPAKGVHVHSDRPEGVCDRHEGRRGTARPAKDGSGLQLHVRLHQSGERPSNPLITAHLDGLMPDSVWRERLAVAVRDGEATTRPARRKQVLVDAFSDMLKRLGRYPYVLETPVYFPLADRTFYSLIYATRSTNGLEVLRDCQVVTLIEQESRRGKGKIEFAAERSGQTELFGSLATLASRSVDV